jgi:hypothetical protein
MIRQVLLHQLAYFSTPCEITYPTLIYLVITGAAAALKADDELFTQYREQGMLMWRGTHQLE